VPLVNNADDANKELPSYFEMGVQNGHSLIQLQQLIRDVSVILTLICVLFIRLCML
jgi:hypothetical protein